MSTTRHRRRTWRQAGSQAAAGILIGADATWTVHTRSGLADLATIALVATATALICNACSVAVSIGWHRGRHKYLVYAVAQAPLRRPLYPLVDDPDNPNDEVALHYVTQADNWRNDVPGGLDAIIGPRPYNAPAVAAASETAAQ